MRALGPRAWVAGVSPRYEVVNFSPSGEYGLLVDFRDDPWPQATDEGASERSAREEAAGRAPGLHAKVSAVDTIGSQPQVVPCPLVT